MKMRMRLAFLLLLAAVLTLCSSHMGNDPGQNSGEDSHQNSPQDSFWDVEASPWISPRGSHHGSGTAALRLLPAPVLLRHKPSRMRCLAPPGFSIGSFELLQEISGIFVQNIVVITNQGWADFPLPRAAVCFRCRYQSHNGSTWLESELSPAIGSSDLGDAECQPRITTARTSQNDPSWLLPVLVVGLLLLGAVVIIWRYWRGSRNRESWGAQCPGGAPQRQMRRVLPC